MAAACRPAQPRCKWGPAVTSGEVHAGDQWAGFSCRKLSLARLAPAAPSVVLLAIGKLF